MKIYKVIERATGKVVSELSEKNVKSAPTVESIPKMRKLGDGAFIIEVKGLSYDQEWWSVNEHDLVIEG